MKQKFNYKQFGQRLLRYLYFQLLELVPGNELYQIMNIKAPFQTRQEGASNDKILLPFNGSFILFELVLDLSFLNSS